VGVRVSDPDKHHAARSGDFIAAQSHSPQGDRAARAQNERVVAVGLNRPSADRATGQTVLGPLLAACEDAMIRIVHAFDNGGPGDLERHGGAVWDVKRFSGRGRERAAVDDQLRATILDRMTLVGSVGYDVGQRQTTALVTGIEIMCEGPGIDLQPIAADVAVRDGDDDRKPAMPDAALVVGQRHFVAVPAPGPSRHSEWCRSG
jgi:hypothetical protein